jgi:hypothetical protein
MMPVAVRASEPGSGTVLGDCGITVSSGGGFWSGGTKIVESPVGGTMIWFGGGGVGTNVESGGGVVAESAGGFVAVESAGGAGGLVVGLPCGGAVESTGGGVAGGGVTGGGDAGGGVVPPDGGGVVVPGSDGSVGVVVETKLGVPLDPLAEWVIARKRAAPAVLPPAIHLPAWLLSFWLLSGVADCADTTLSGAAIIAAVARNLAIRIWHREGAEQKVNVTIDSATLLGKPRASLHAPDFNQPDSFWLINWARMS